MAEMSPGHPPAPVVPAPAATPTSTPSINAQTSHAQATGGISRAIAGPRRVVSRLLRGQGSEGVGAASGGGGRNGSSVVDCAIYAEGGRLAGQWTYEQALAAARRTPGAFVWLGLHEPGPEDLEGIASAFNLDDFAVEDAVKGSQRPKIEQYGDVAFLVLRTARYVEHTELTETSEIVETGDLMMFIGPDFVITVRHGEANALGPIRADLEANRPLLAQGPWSVVYVILDRVVDTYLEVAGRVEEDIDAVEAQVFSRHVHGRIARIYQLKRELVEFKRAVVPLQRPLHALVEGRLGAVPSEIIRNFRDVNDHLARTVDQVSSYDDLLNSILQARLAQVTVDQNHDMRKIASWAAIAAMQTAIAGVYGMNFKVMPELDWKFGYPVILMIMFGSAIALYNLFRRSGWL